MYDRGRIVDVGVSRLKNGSRGFNHFHAVHRPIGSRYVRSLSPNITGGFTLDVVSVGRFGIADVQGAFTASAPYDILFDPGASMGKQYTRAEFSAASSNAIYSGSSVQPPALLLLPCIKV